MPIPAGLSTIMRPYLQSHGNHRNLAPLEYYVCTSRIESYPRVTLEAMYYGLPLVTTPVFGITEQVREGINAFFYEPGNPRELAQALTEIVSDKATLQRMGNNSSLVLQTLTDHDAMINAYGELFREAFLSNVG